MKTEPHKRIKPASFTVRKVTRGGLPVNKADLSMICVSVYVCDIRSEFLPVLHFMYRVLDFKETLFCPGDPN